MVTQEPEFDREYLEFVELFNQGEYEASHQALMGAWQQNISYDFYKGLIQLAGALQHWDTENAFWAEDLLASSHNLLEKYAPVHEGLDVQGLMAVLRECNQVARMAREAGGREHIDVSMPEVHLTRVGRTDS